MRCDISGDLYPITTKPTTTKSLSPIFFVALSKELWNNRFGHRGTHVLGSLHRNNFILCNKFQKDFFCHSCPIEKQIKLSFYESFSYTLLPF